jgi:hypothetical protein
MVLVGLTFIEEQRDGLLVSLELADTLEARTIPIVVRAVLN